MHTQPSHRKSLNPGQLQVLRLLYKYRFATTELLAQYQEQKYKQVIYSRLKILLEQEYLGQNYDASYKLQGKQASYYLLTKGTNVLKEEHKFNPDILRASLKDRNASDRFITHSLNVFTIHNSFKALYPNEFKYFSESDLSSFDYFPKKLPNTYLSRIDVTSKQPKDYFVDSFEEITPFFVIINQIKQYIAYNKDEAWQKKTKRKFAVLLAVCDTATLEKRLKIQVAKSLPGDMKFYSCTEERLANAVRLIDTAGLWQSN